VSEQKVGELKPFLSILLIIATLLAMAFFKMEVRRMGYAVFSASRSYKLLRDRHRLQVMEYAQVTRSDLVRKIAVSRFTLNDARVGQIIQMTGGQIAMPQ